MGLSRPVGRALRASVAAGDARAGFRRVVDAVWPVELEGLGAAATYHGVAGYVWHAAQGREAVLGAQWAALERARQQALFGHLRTLAGLRELAAILDGASVPWLVVKGPVLAETVHAGPDLRAYSDLDVLVPAGLLGTALAGLEAAGCTTLDRNWTLIHREMKGEVHVQLPSGTVVDLHWHLLNDREVREQYTLDTDPLFERSRVVQVARMPVRTLDEVDTIVYLALHTMLSGGHRLVWLKDLERALECTAASAGELGRRARTWGAELALATAAARVRRAIGGPAAVRSSSAPGVAARAWLTVSDAVWRLVPAEREDGRGSLARMVARSVRPTAGASTRTLAAKLRAVGGAERDAPRVRIDPRSPASDRHESGGAPARRAFLEAVARSQA